jgi:hypothetical protein
MRGHPFGTGLRVAAHVLAHERLGLEHGDDDRGLGQVR